MSLTSTVSGVLAVVVIIASTTPIEVALGGILILICLMECYYPIDVMENAQLDRYAAWLQDEADGLHTNESSTSIADAITLLDSLGITMTDIHGNNVVFTEDGPTWFTLDEADDIESSDNTSETHKDDK